MPQTARRVEATQWRWFRRATRTGAAGGLTGPAHGHERLHRMRTSAGEAVATPPAGEWTISASGPVRAIVAQLARTEDVRFSPSGRRLAVAAFARNRIVVFDVESGATEPVRLERALEIESPALHQPHGVDFLDEDRIVVANRDGAAPVFQLPAGEATPRVHELPPLFLIPADASTGLHTPGSVAALPLGDDGHELIFCNNYAHTVTRHTLGRDGTVRDSCVLIRKWLAIPDGVAVDPERRWIAISNHDTQTALLYERRAEPGEHGDPDGMLGGMDYPHGIRFTADGRHLLAADAGAPFVHVFTRPAQGWRGVHLPALSFRVMDEAVHLKGRYNPQEGGPKGLDLDPAMRVLVVTSAHQPLAFFDLQAILAEAARRPGPDPVRTVGLTLRQWDQARIDRECADAQVRSAEKSAAESASRAIAAEAAAAGLRHSAQQAAEHIAVLQNSLSWRFTAPLRAVHATVRRFFQ